MTFCTHITLYIKCRTASSPCPESRAGGRSTQHPAFGRKGSWEPKDSTVVFPLSKKHCEAVKGLRSSFLRTWPPGSSSNQNSWRRHCCGRGCTGSPETLLKIVRDCWIWHNTGGDLLQDKVPCISFSSHLSRSEDWTKTNCCGKTPSRSVCPDLREDTIHY